MPANHSPKSVTQPPPTHGGLSGILKKRLSRFSATLNHAEDFPTLLNAILSQCQPLFEAESASIWFIDKEGQFLELGGSRHIDMPGTLPIKDRSLQDAFGKRQPTRIAEDSTLKQYFGGHGLIIPLMTGLRRLGVIMISRNEPLDEAMSVAAGEVGSRASLAIANAGHVSNLARYLKRYDTAHDRLQRLHQVLDPFTRVRTEEEAFTLIAEMSCSILGYNYTALYVRRSDSYALAGMSVRQPYHPSFHDECRDMDLDRLDIVREARELNQPVSINHLHADPRLSRTFSRQHLDHCAVVPINIEGEHIGILYVARHRGSREITVADLELLAFYSRMCASCVNNARYLAYREQIADIAKITADTPDDYLSQVAHQLPLLLRARAAVIAIPNQEGILEVHASSSPDVVTPAYRKWLRRLKFTEDTFPLETFHTGTLREAPFLKGSLTVPIRYEPADQNLGVMHLFDRVSGEFTSRDISLVTGLTIQIGYILKNIELVKRLEAEREQFVSIVNDTADGIVTLDTQGCIQLCNPSMAQVTGYREGDVRGKLAEEVFEPQAEDEQPFRFSALQKDGKHAQHTISIATRDRGRRWVGVSVAPVTTQSGISMILVFRDITEQYEFMQRQSEFVSIASHELRTPITALIGFLSLSNTVDNPEQREHFTTRAHSAAVRLSELVEDLLSVARIEEGRLNLAMAPVNPGELMDEVITSLMPIAERKSIRVLYANRLGKDDEILVDRSKLMQVYANLVENAIKYTPGQGKVDVTVHRKAKEIFITVKDNGIGISKQNLERIFEKFFREHTELSVTAGGTGLGLFITKQLVERQNGSLTIESTKDVGTTAVVTFPRYQPTPDRAG